MKKFPCKECITRPICSLLVEKQIYISLQLRHKCSIFSDYHDSFVRICKRNNINNTTTDIAKQFLDNIYNVFGKWDSQKKCRITKDEK